MNTSGPYFGRAARAKKNEARSGANVARPYFASSALAGLGADSSLVQKPGRNGLHPSHPMQTSWKSFNHENPGSDIYAEHCGLPSSLWSPKKWLASKIPSTYLLIPAVANVSCA